MAGSITGTVSFAINLADLLPVGPTRLSQYTIPVIAGISQTWSPGTAANQAQLVYQASGAAPASPVDTDLTSCVCADGTAGMGHVRLYAIINTDPTNVLTIGLPSALTNGFAPTLGGTNPTITIEPGEWKCFSIPLGAAGWVVDSTHKIIRIDPGGNSVAYKLIVLGY